jgi:hypothetical protein
VLGLAVTDEALAQLRHLRRHNPELFGRLSDRINEVRRDPGGRNAGRSFLLDDGRVARLATFHDAGRGSDHCLVWLIEEDAQGPVVTVVWAAPFDEIEH